MLLVKFVVNVISIRVAEKRLGLFVLRLQLTYRLGGKIDCAGNAIECQMQFVELSTRMLKAQLDSSILPFSVRWNLVQSLIQVNDLGSHLERESFDSQHSNYNQDSCCYHDNNWDFEKDIFYQLIVQFCDLSRNPVSSDKVG